MGVRILISWSSALDSLYIKFEPVCLLPVSPCQQHSVVPVSILHPSVDWVFLSSSRFNLLPRLSRFYLLGMFSDCFIVICDESIPCAAVTRPRSNAKLLKEMETPPSWSGRVSVGGRGKRQMWRVKLLALMMFRMSFQSFTILFFSHLFPASYLTKCLLSDRSRWPSG